MKKSWILLILAVFIFACNRNNNNENTIESESDLTVINGTLDNNDNPYVFITYNNITDTIKVDKKGKFSAKIMVYKPTYIVFTTEKISTGIFCNPKSKVEFNANIIDFWNTLSFTGDDSQVNNYIARQNKIIQLAGINSEEFLYASTFQKFSDSLEKLLEKLQNEFDNFSNENIDKYPDFINIENQRLQLIEASLILSYYSPVINSGKIIDDAEQRITEILSTIDINNPKLLNLNEFKPFVQNVLNYLISKDIIDKNLEIKTAEEYANMYFNIIDQYFVENAVREELYYIFLKDFIEYYGPESVIEIFDTYKGFVTNRNRLSEFDKIFAEYNKLEKGQPSVDWSFQDMNGNNYSLSDFRGKYVYLDVWASWCGPCKREIPYLKELKETFKDKNIEIIQISVDDKKEDWINIVQSENLQGIQLYAGGWDNDLCDFFKINGIPRFILIDQSGNIINSNAERPSGDIEQVLNNLSDI